MIECLRCATWPCNCGDGVTIIHGDATKALEGIEPGSIDAIVTDPPYGLKFMGKRWDVETPGMYLWARVFQVLKPGGHLLCFAGTRTHHRMALGIEEAGFHIRDMLAWVYGSGFPKSHNVSKAIDKAAGAEREVVGKTTVCGAFKQAHQVSQGYRPDNGAGGYKGERDGADITAPATDEAKQWDGWGTALKPAFEPITLARKPFAGTVANNVLEHGTGAINVDGCRVGRDSTDVSGWATSGSKASSNRSMSGGNYARNPKPDAPGRWPANLVHDGSEDATCPLGDASRFFYCAKASKRDRDEGLEGTRGRFAPTMGNGIGGKEHDPDTATQKKNHHPTVKPTDLMRYLCRLITPPGGIVLDPFMGSGSTGKAAVAEGFRFIGIEINEEYCSIARERIDTTK